MRNYIQYINKNKILLQKVLEIDDNKWNEKNNLEDLLSKESLNITLEKNKTYLVICEGQPEIIMRLIEKAVEVNSSIIFTIKDYYLATNKALVALANKCILENNKQLFFKIYNNINEQKIYEASQTPDKTIYIGNKENFEYIKKNIKGETIFIEYE